MRQIQLRQVTYKNEVPLEAAKRYAEAKGLTTLFAIKQLKDVEIVLEYSFDGGVSWHPVEQVTIIRKTVEY